MPRRAHVAGAVAVGAAVLFAPSSLGGPVGSAQDPATLIRGAEVTVRGHSGRQEWVLEPAAPRDNGYIAPGQWLRLRSVTNGFQAVVYERRSNGINLGWDIRPAARVRFVADPRRRETPSVASRTPYALEIAEGGFLRYDARPTGINLEWSAAPVYEWEVHTDLTLRVSAPAGRPVGLWNTTAKDYVVYCSRSSGINLRWSSDCVDPLVTARTVVLVRIPLRGSGTPCRGTMRVELRPVETREATYGVLPISERRDAFTLTTVVFDQKPAPISSASPDEYWCVAGNVAERMAPGTWKVFVDISSWYPPALGQTTFRPWSTSCTRTVSAGKPGQSLSEVSRNWITLTFGVSACGYRTWPRIP